MPLRKRRTPVEAEQESTPDVLDESVLNLSELKTLSMQELMSLAEKYQLENVSAMRKQVRGEAMP